MSRSASARLGDAATADGMRRTAAAIVIGLSLVACGPSAAPSATMPPSQGPRPQSTATAGVGLGAFPPLPTGQMSGDMAATMQSIVDEAVRDVRAPGMAAAVISAGHGTWVSSAGTADGDAPLDPDAQFGIGSVTKTIIAAAVLKLVESGAVDLDRPIAEYLGEDDFATNGATVRQVLGMRSGIGDPQVGADTCRSDLAASISLADLRKVPLGSPFFEPGVGFRYTNSNYDLAGILIEEVTGSTLASVLRSGVLSAPGLERLIYQDAERPTPPLAGPFVILPGSEPVPGPQELLQLGDGYLPARCLASSAGPAGGMASDAMTLAKWGYLLYGGRVLGDEMLSAMADFKDGYGLAAHDHASLFGVPALGHEGTVPGYVSVLLAFPEDGLVTAVLVNTNDVDENDLITVAGRLRDALAQPPGGGS